MSQCLGVKSTGAFCTKRPGSNGFCKSCDPNASRDYEREEQQLRREEAAAARAKVLKKEQSAEIMAQEIKDKILEITDLEGLRRLELKVLEMFVSVDCSIDARFGSAIVQLLKHQADMLQAVKPDEGLKGAGQREIAIQIALKMTPEQQLMLLGDFAQGMKLIEKQAKSEVVDISYKVVENERA